jgi:hypothetical protein
MRQCLTPIPGAAFDRGQAPPIGGAGSPARLGGARPLRPPQFKCMPRVASQGSGISSSARRCRLPRPSHSRMRQCLTPVPGAAFDRGTADRRSRIASASRRSQTPPAASVQAHAPRGEPGVWHLLIRAALPATATQSFADEAMPDPDRERSGGRALPASARPPASAPPRAHEKSARPSQVGAFAFDRGALGAASNGSYFWAEAGAWAGAAPAGACCCCSAANL